MEIIAYHPHNAEPIVIAKLSKQGEKDEDGKYKEEPYRPQTDKNTEIWDFRFTATNDMGVSSSDKIYIRLTTDRKTTTVYDEDGNPVEDSVLAYTKTAFYSNPDLRQSKPPQEQAAAPSVDINALIEQLKNSPELANTLASLLSGENPTVSLN